MGNFFNNGPNILKLIVRVRIYHYTINDFSYGGHYDLSTPRK